MSKRLLFVALACALAGPVSAQDIPRPVKLVTVEAPERGLTRKFFGHVVARRTVDLAFQVSGQIIELPVVEGQTIAQGALIAKLDPEPFQLSLDQARVQQDQADRTVNRLSQLTSSTVSQVTVDDSISAADLAAIDVRNAERAMNDSTLTAPFDALIARRISDNFETVSAGSPIVRLHDMSELRIDIDVPEVLFQRAGENPDVEVVAEFPGIDGSFPLAVREFNAETSDVGQTFRLTLALAPVDGLVILPGSSVTVRATLLNEETGIVVPREALMPQSDGTTEVLVFSASDGDTGTVSLRTVTLQVADDGTPRVVEGLSPGDAIVAAGATRISDGETVRRFDGFPD